MSNIAKLPTMETKRRVFLLICYQIVAFLHRGVKLSHAQLQTKAATSPSVRACRHQSAIGQIRLINDSTKAATFNFQPAVSTNLPFAVAHERTQFVPSAEVDRGNCESAFSTC